MSVAALKCLIINCLTVHFTLPHFTHTVLYISFWECVKRTVDVEEILSTFKTWNTFYVKSDLRGWEVEPDKDSETRLRVSGDLSCVREHGSSKIMSHVFGQTKREETRGGRDTHSSWLLQICPLSVCRFSVVAILRYWREHLVFSHTSHVTFKRILAYTYFHVNATKIKSNLSPPQSGQVIGRTWVTSNRTTHYSATVVTRSLSTLSSPPLFFFSMRTTYFLHVK